MAHPTVIADIGVRLALALQRAAVHLPWPLQRALGRGLGRCLRLLRQRSRIAERNLQLCFPRASDDERKLLLREHFSSLGIGLMELGMAWHGSERRIARLGRVAGLENLARAKAAGRGVLLISGHFTTLDMMNRLLGAEIHHAGVYRPIGNARFDAAMHRGRSRTTQRVFPKSDIRSALRLLGDNGTLLMSIDQADTSAGAVDAPFFGHAAATMTTPARLAERTGCAVVPVFSQRTAGGRYEISIEPALEEFPGSDRVQDAERLNAVIESHVRRCPAQYYWIHRRFKTTQNADVYDD